MSFKTVARLDSERSDVRRDLNDRDRMHKRLMSLYPDGLGANPRQALNLLFAIEPGTSNILIQSDLAPVVGPLNSARNGYFTAVKTEDLDSSLQFSTGDTVEFCFWMAAVKRSTGSKKRIAMTEKSEMLKRGKLLLSASGLSTDEIYLASKEQICSAKRGINYPNALLVGKGLVTDAEKLKKSIIRGIGAGRLWGSGVLLVS